MARSGSYSSHVIPWPGVLGILCALLSLMSADQVLIPDFIIASQTAFNTNMINADLDAARKQEIKSTLEPMLTFVFKNVTGFKSAEVVSIAINEAESTLLANWTVRLNRTDPKFVNATSAEIYDIVLPELEAASKLYKNYIVIDAWKRPRSSISPTAVFTASGEDDKLALALGVGLGLGLPALALVILVVVLLARRKKTPGKKPPISSSSESSSGRTDNSTILDPTPFTYPINGGFVPSEYGKLSTSSISGKSVYIEPVIYDTLSVSAPSEDSRVYTVLK